MNTLLKRLRILSGMLFFQEVSYCASSVIGLTAGLGISSGATKSEYGSLKDETFSQGLDSLIKTYSTQKGNTHVCINCISPAFQVKNKMSASYTMGVWTQHVNLSKITLGARWLLGRSLSSSLCNYQTGVLQDYRFLNNGIQKFSFKNSWFTTALVDGGYVLGPFQLRLGLGAGLYRQKLYCINNHGKSCGALFKTVSGPVVSVGGLWWVTRRISFSLEYQCQWIAKTSWNKIACIVPEKSFPYGAPVLKMRTSIFLLSGNYVFRMWSC